MLVKEGVKLDGDFPLCKDKGNMGKARDGL